MRKITTDSLNWFWEKGVKPIKEKVENLKNTMDTMLKISEIVNNCVTDNPDLPLAAAQGKFLMDQITGLYSDMSIRYNTDTDYIQIYTGTQWIDWTIAGFLFNGILFSDGKFNAMYFSSKNTFTAQNSSPIVKINGYIELSVSVPSNTIGYGLLVFETPIKLKKWNILHVVGYKLSNSAQQNSSVAIGVSKSKNITSIQNIPYKYTLSESSDVQKNIDTLIDLTSIVDNDDWYIYLYVAQTLNGTSSYNRINVLHIEKLVLEL